MHNLLKYINYARYGYLKGQSFQTYLMEEALGVGIQPIRPKGWIDALAWGSYFVENDDSRKYRLFSGEYVEAISYEFARDEGGVIVFSTDVTTVYNKSFGDAVVNFFRSKYETIINRLRKNKILDEIFADKRFEKVSGYSIGNFFKGKYFDRESGKSYDENSLSIEIIGIPIELLIAIGEAVAKEFNQKEVLIKDNSSQRIMIVISKNG